MIAIAKANFASMISWFSRRYLGFCGKNDKNSYRFTWGEMAMPSHSWCFKINNDDEDGWMLIFGLIPGITFYIYLPYIKRRKVYDDMCDNWGFSVNWDGEVHLDWREKTKVLFPFWWYDQIDSHILQEDGTWRKLSDSKKKFAHLRGIELYRANTAYMEADAHSETHPYTYTLRSGTVQNVDITFKVRRDFSRRKFIRWLPLFTKVYNYVDFSFSSEVGERTGSWKGGTVGSTEAIRKGETPIDAVRRMERERKFR